MSKTLEKIKESLSPLERKIVPYLNLSLKEIEEKTPPRKTINHIFRK
jgi:hypothetical protein